MAPPNQDPGTLKAAWHGGQPSGLSALCTRRWQALTTAPSRAVDFEDEWNGTTHDNVLPMLDFKVSWYLSDHTAPGHACT